MFAPDPTDSLRVKHRFEAYMAEFVSGIAWRRLTGAMEIALDEDCPSSDRLGAAYLHVG